MWNFVTELAMPFSIVNRGETWFWCSYSLTDGGDETLIGPFPSHDEAEKDARATLMAPAGSDRAIGFRSDGLHQSH
jgi:hypothetical protein